MADNIVPANMLLYSLYYDIISLTSLKITQTFHLLLGFAAVFWDFKIRNSIRITEGSDNGDSDNRGPTVHTTIYKHLCMLQVNQFENNIIKYGTNLISS